MVASGIKHTDRNHDNHIIKDASSGNHSDKKLPQRRYGQIVLNLISGEYRARVWYTIRDVKESVSINDDESKGLPRCWRSCMNIHPIR